MGVIAQEVQAVLPEIVSIDREGILSVDYGKLSALLIEVNQEQQDKKTFPISSDRRSERCDW